jgi:hypothetical protein
MRVWRWRKVVPDSGGRHNPLHIPLRDWQNSVVPHWLIKSAIHRAISFLPRSERWNEMFQIYVTKSLEVDRGGFEQRLEFCRRHLEHFLELQPARRENFSVFELGTGWFPIVPVGLYLCGASEIWTFDIVPLLRSSRMKRTLEYFCEYDRKGELRKHLPQLRPERMARLREALVTAESETPQALLERFKIHAVIRDARATGLSANSIDLFFSTSVLEHIPRDILGGIFREFRRLASNNAAMSHRIGLDDQYHYLDRSITPFNFMRYSDRAWKYLDSPLTPHNRLRISDYRALFREAGFEVAKEINTSGASNDLEKVRLAPEFQNYSTDDLLVLTSWLVAKPVSDPDAK